MAVWLEQRWRGSVSVSLWKMRKISLSFWDCHRLHTAWISVLWSGVVTPIHQQQNSRPLLPNRSLAEETPQSFPWLSTLSHLLLRLLLMALKFPIHQHSGLRFTVSMGSMSSRLVKKSGYFTIGKWLSVWPFHLTDSVFKEWRCPANQLCERQYPAQVSYLSSWTYAVYSCLQPRRVVGSPYPR